MGMPIRRFAEEVAPQPKRRRAASPPDSDATDSAPEWSVNEMLARVSAIRRAPPPTRRRVLQMMRSQTPAPPRELLVADSDSDILGSPRFHRRRRLRRMPHDMIRPAGDGSGIDRAACSQVAAYYTSRNGGKGALHLCKTRNSNIGLSVVFADITENAIDVGRWWLIGSWTTDSTLDGQTVLQVLLDVLQESSNIHSCTVSNLVICDELELDDGVRAGIQLLKRMRDLPPRRRYGMVDTEIMVNMTLDQVNVDSDLARIANNSEEQDSEPTSSATEADDCFEGSFSHPVTGDVVHIGVE